MRRVEQTSGINARRSHRVGYFNRWTQFVAALNSALRCGI